MELDLKTIKALSSRTRIQILNELLKKDSTPTSISKKLEKSKSTVSNHLEKLMDAGLLTKDEKEGRKRVLYSPTRKAENIVKGKEKKVKFSLGSSVISMIASLGLSTHLFLETFFSDQVAQDSAQMSLKSVEKAGAEQTTAFSPEILLFISLALLGISTTAFLYGYTINKLDS